MNYQWNEFAIEENGFIVIILFSFSFPPFFLSSFFILIDLIVERHLSKDANSFNEWERRSPL